MPLPLSQWFSCPADKPPLVSVNSHLHRPPVRKVTPSNSYCPRFRGRLVWLPPVAAADARLLKTAKAAWKPCGSGSSCEPDEELTSHRLVAPSAASTESAGPGFYCLVLLCVCPTLTAPRHNSCQRLGGSGGLSAFPTPAPPLNRLENCFYQASVATLIVVI